VAGPYADDRGDVEPRLADAISAYAAGDAHLVDVQRALVSARVLGVVVPGDDGTLSAVSITGRDGRIATPVFSSVRTAAGWNPAARPFPITGPDAARGAIDVGSAAVVLDISGTVPIELQGPLLLALSDGVEWCTTPSDPHLAAAVAAALADVPDLEHVELGASPSAGLLITVVVAGVSGERSNLAPEVALAAVADRIQAVLRAAGFPDPLLPAGMDLAIVGSNH